MIALANAIQNGTIPNAEIALVISDRSDAKGLLAAEERGLKTLVIERRGRKREEHDREIVSVLRQERVDLICLAGYMRVLSPFFVDAFAERIINIHPSLLPLFPGLDPQRQALDHGAKVSGCTVHFVDNTLDGGPIIAQRPVPVLDDDTVETLSARILEQEHILYPEAVRSIVDSIVERRKRK
jgi:phosphoribosylglycinamide formyltransferase-1